MGHDQTQQFQCCFWLRRGRLRCQRGLQVPGFLLIIVSTKLSTYLISHRCYSPIPQPTNERTISLEADIVPAVQWVLYQHVTRIRVETFYRSNFIRGVSAGLKRLTALFCRSDNLTLLFCFDFRPLLPASTPAR